MAAGLLCSSKTVVNHLNQNETKMEKEIRKIKVQGRYVRTTWASKTVPELKLQGDWLHDAGFECGSKTTIKVEQGRLTIINI